MPEVLVAQTGREIGSATSRRLRKEGAIPGVVYGLDEAPVAVAVDFRELRAALTTDAGLNALIELEIDGDTQLSIVKDMQRHPVRNDVTHVDFLRIARGVEISVEVPIILIGDAKAVNDEQGIVDQSMFSLTISSIPSAIPNEIEYDISEMTIVDTITVADLVMPEGVRTDMDPEQSVASAMVTRAAMSEEEEAAEGEEGEATEGDAAADDAGGDDSGDNEDGD